MIGTYDVELCAAQPQLPLPRLCAFVNSPSSVRLRGVPRQVGSWKLTAVSLSYTLPSNVVSTSACKLVGGIWIGSVPACATVGSSAKGLKVVASGTDENGDAVTGYALGVADIEILSADAAVAQGVTKYALRFCQTVPASPVEGDVAYVANVLKWYHAGQWIALGGGSGDVRHDEFAGIDPETVDVFTLATILKGNVNA